MRIDLTKMKQQHAVELPEHIVKTDFPLDIFPPDIQYVISAVCQYAGFEPQVSAASILFVISTVIGNSRSIHVKSSWIDTPNLWLAIVGRRGTMKTPTVSFFIKPLTNDEKQFDIDFGSRLSEFLKVPKKDRNEADKPNRRQRYSNDPTVEGLIKAMSDNWRGMGIYKDELNGFFEEMNRYKSGGNLEFYLSAFSGGQYIKNRMSYDAITINDMFLSMLGSIQPEKLRSLAGSNTENGMIDRWLYVVSDNLLQHTTADEIPPEMISTYHMFVDNVKNSVNEIKTMEWLPGAKEQFIIVINELEDIMKADDCDESLYTYMSKIKTYLARFTLIIAMMDGSTFIGIDHINKARRLALYFMDTALKTFVAFEKAKTIEVVMDREKAVTVKERVLAMFKNFPDMNHSQIAVDIGCSRQYVIKCKQEFTVKVSDK